MLYLKILSVVLLIPGIILVYFAKFIATKYNIALKVKCNIENELDEREIEQYRYNKAIINIKVIGLFFVIPALILALISFR